MGAEQVRSPAKNFRNVSGNSRQTFSPVFSCRFGLASMLAAMVFCAFFYSQPLPQVLSRQDGLKPGTSVEREIRNVDVHEYWLQVSSGQFVQIFVDQGGVDLSVSGIDAAGQSTQFDGRWLGIESASVLADMTGTHRFQVRTVSKTLVAAGVALLIGPPDYIVDGTREIIDISS